MFKTGMTTGDFWRVVNHFWRVVNLKSMNFLAPEGQNLKYFIVPLNQNNEVISNTAQSSGFVPLANENQVKGVTDNIVYSKRDLKSKQSVSKPSFDPTAIPEEFPITKEVSVATQYNDPQLLEGRQPFCT